MYKLILSLRYLKTRWIALASIVSVMLGVATLIVVNSVMGGFTNEMRAKIQGVLADVIVERWGLDFEYTPEMREKIENAVGDKIEAMSPVYESVALLVLDYPYMDQRRIEPVQLHAVDPVGRSKVGPWSEFMADSREGDIPTLKVDKGTAALLKERRIAQGLELDPSVHKPPQVNIQIESPNLNPFEDQVLIGEDQVAVVPSNPFDKPGSDLVAFEEIEAEYRGLVVPWLLSSFRHNGKDVEVIRPGDEVSIILPSVAGRLEPRFSRCVVVNRFKSGMSEYDQSRCYMDLKELQQLLGLENRVTSVQIRLKDFNDAPYVVAELQKLFPMPYVVSTWQQKQGPLMAAVAMETRLLNILLFMIIAVAGFGILAIFFMIVVEKTRDIGILKALGASDRGVQGIFLSYGCALGAVGSGLGLIIGLAIVTWLDKIESLIGRLSGHDVFDRDLYYFDHIPALIDPLNILVIVAGAMFIAVAASIFPARRAAKLRTVEALRFNA